MKEQTQALEHASVKQYCNALRAPMIGAHFVQLARLKTLEEFDFTQAREIPAAKIRELAEGGYIERAEPVVLMGECGTGKTRLATGLCVAACRAEAASTIHHRCQSGERTGRSAATQRSEASPGALVALRRHRARRSGLCAIG